MKFYFKLFVAGFLLFAGGNLALTQALTVDDFNSIWDNEPSNVCYSGSSVIACSCTTGDAVRGCVRDAKQSAGSFSGEGEVEIRKLVWPTSIPGVFDVHVLLRGKRVSQTRNDLNVCSVVVFDESGSMGKKTTSGSDNTYTPNEKWYSAVSGAKEFSQIVVDGNPNAKVGLVTFGTKVISEKQLGRDVFDDSLFYLDPSGQNTNVHDGLIHAREIFPETGCDAKYIVLMSDGVPTNYMSGNTSILSGNSSNSYKGAREVTVSYAQELKSEGIIIYSIGYEVASSSVAAQTLESIATDSSHYFLASSSNISDIFQDIGNVTVELNAGVSSSLNDEIGGAMLRMGDIEISSGAQITDPGAVYSFQIKIKPDVTGFQPSNDGLTLSYTDVTGDSQTLSIDPDDSAQIYWTAPKCGGTYPSGVAVVIGSDEFTQDWNGDTLVPESKEWTYTGSSTPGECEWTCSGANYNGNTDTNTCELDIYTIKFNKNGGNGTMSNQILSYGTTGTLKANTFTRNGYHFSGWNTNANGAGTRYANKGQILAATGTVTLYAQWTPNTYTVEFSGNGATSGTMAGQVFTYDLSGNLSSNQFVKTGYHFTGWNTQANGSGTKYENEVAVKNLLTTGTFNLYAQWEPNNYNIVFDGNGASKGTMSPLSAVYDSDIKLTKNAFENNGAEFLGWNTSPDGKGISYTDEQTVRNLATEGEVRLYAQWKRLGSSGGGGGGGGGCKKDDCPDGDYSGDRCDGKCGTPPSPQENKLEPTPVPDPEPTPVITIKKCSIEGSTYSAEVNEAYIWACERGILKSNTIQGARLGEYLNRAEMAKITTIFEMGELNAKPNRDKDCSAFADSISGYNQEMKDYMVTSCQLLRMGIHTADYTPIKDFMPKKFVSRAEFGTILSRILWGNKYEAPKNTKYYYVEHLNKLKQNGILTNIDPTLVERRSYAILMIYRAAKMMGKI